MTDTNVNQSKPSDRAEAPPAAKDLPHPPAESPVVQEQEAKGEQTVGNVASALEDNQQLQDPQATTTLRDSVDALYKEFKILMDSNPELLAEIRNMPPVSNQQLLESLQNLIRTSEALENGVENDLEIEQVVAETEIVPTSTELNSNIPPTLEKPAEDIEMSYDLEEAIEQVVAETEIVPTSTELTSNIPQTFSLNSNELMENGNVDNVTEGENMEDLGAEMTDIDQTTSTDQDMVNLRAYLEFEHVYGAGEGLKQRPSTFRESERFPTRLESYQASPFREVSEPGSSGNRSEERAILSEFREKAGWNTSSSDTPEYSSNTFDASSLKISDYPDVSGRIFDFDRNVSNHDQFHFFFVE